MCRGKSYAKRSNSYGGYYQMICKKCNNEMNEKFARPKDMPDTKFWFECGKCNWYVEFELGELN